MHSHRIVEGHREPKEHVAATSVIEIVVADRHCRRADYILALICLEWVLRVLRSC